MIFTLDPAEFVWHYSTYHDKEKLRERIRKHIEYKTCRIIYDINAHVCAVCLWNIIDLDESARIIDLVIREDARGKDIMRKILRDGMKVWPVKYLVFDRDYTEDGSNRGKERKISTDSFLRRKA